jgi:LETM1 and EF-hand domain-containing protein 1, mitochondrial
MLVPGANPETIDYRAISAQFIHFILSTKSNYFASKPHFSIITDRIHRPDSLSCRFDRRSLPVSAGSGTMYLNRTASTVTPLLLRSSTRAFQRNLRPLRREVPAIAILLPHRGLSTDTATSAGSGGTYPPPGFNADQAKKPIPKEEQQKSLGGKVAATASEKREVTIPKDKPTSYAKTKAVEAQTLSELASEKAAADKAEEKKLTKKKEEDKKLSIWQKVKREALHYWDGTKLLVTEVKISSKLALKMAAGYELTRREHRQVRIVDQYAFMENG